MDTINVEVNARDLAERIVREAARRPQPAGKVLTLIGRPPVPGTRTAPVVERDFQTTPLRKKKIIALLQRAREKTSVSRRVPKLLRRLFRKQGGYNDLVLESIAALLNVIEGLHAQSTAVTAHFRTLSPWLAGIGHSHETLAVGRRQDRAMLSATVGDLHDLRNRVVRIEARARSARDSADEQTAQPTTAQIDSFDQTETTLRGEMAQLRQTIEQANTAIAEMRQSHAAEISDLQANFAKYLHPASLLATEESGPVDAEESDAP